MARSRTTTFGAPPAEDRATGGPTALLIIDMISDWDFPDADGLLPQAMRIASAIAALANRFRTGQMPVIYANDNHGRWRSDFRQVVAAALNGKGGGAEIARALAPRPDDYFVLKPKHSSFHATPLD